VTPGPRPLQVFVDAAFLADARACLRPGGCVVFNIACRVPAVLDAILGDVSAAFDWAMQMQISVRGRPASGMFATARTAPTPCNTAPAVAPHARRKAL